MDIQLLKTSKIHPKSKIEITGSKSESNRLLLLQALYPEIQVFNLSNSDDSVLMQKALKSTDTVIDIHHAGTAMRFLTAYFSTQVEREIVLTGSKRMKERPIKILVDALRELGAEIFYLEKEGYPPLKIVGKPLSKDKVSLQANVSSQYISALLLIASTLKNGITLKLDGEITSVPYIKMTLSLLNEIGIETQFIGNTISVNPLYGKPKRKKLVVESDWSSASYFYSVVALSNINTEIELSSYKKNSLQGDAVLAEIYKMFGVQTTYNNDSIILKKTNQYDSENPIELDLSDAPDIAQTIVVTAFGSGRTCSLTGLHTLKIKETDRLVALKTELEKFGAEVSITENSLHLKASNEIGENVNVATYNDHRMAMAFAPLGLKTTLTIKDAHVVSKSYPGFWEDLGHIGFELK
ncbi:3-phosphoshikimate 1-carboxyvinyltransferase [Winogradskyella alexanderae]|uniref:3-phosphoshikimate 1-carboxyvinyltransferase n=1 Tax=Winogradskyella alexanderae TaxID=2877123 RepID=A0ABS7XTF5_9FLAO|nr:3-phosphoshikimate 1-carboxyvinyltransferase [Winogradskyella alexanderae]MCA0133308.1 3-phosphoshikimate 1-carboxyvinyltransferase [Winogradskyella alexanderae]